MKTGYIKKALVAILAVLVLVSIVLAPSAKALTLSYNDSVWSSLSVTGPDVTRPGNSEIYTVSGRLSLNMTGSVHVTLWLNSTSQVQKTLLNTIVLPSGTYQAGNNFVQSYQVIIPSDAANNKYLYANLDAGASHFTSIILTLVQNPTYSELQTQVVQLQTNVTNLGSQVNNLQTQLDAAKANSTSLQNQLTSLNSTYKTLLANYNSLVSNSTSDKSALLSQISVLEGELNNLNSTNAALQSQLAGLQSQLNEAQTNSTSLSSQVAILKGNNSALQTQANNLQTDKDSLLNQTASLQNPVSRLQFNSTNLQTMVDNLSNQTSTLHLQVSDLQSKNSTTSILMYLATFVAVAFIVATAYIILIVVKRKEKITEENPLY